MTQEIYLYLTTTGHISGRPHEIEIWFVEHDGCFYLISEKRAAAHWVRNLLRSPAIRFRIGQKSADALPTRAGLATLPVDADLIAAVKAKMEAKYGWSNGLAVEIRPDSA